MSDKEKSKVLLPPKNIPKDGQVIIAIMKEMGIVQYEPKTIIQLTEFVYRYATTILEEARTFANNSKKKVIDIEDVRLALQLSQESNFTTPPVREVLLECARNKNNGPLPLVKPHCGLRLPPDRHCLSAANYILKCNALKKQSKVVNSVSPGIKIVTKPTVSYIKRTNITPVAKQTLTIPNPMNNNANQKTSLKPKIQIQQNIQGSSTILNSISMEIENGLKRKREEDDIDM